MRRLAAEPDHERRWLGRHRLRIGVPGIFGTAVTLDNGEFAAVQSRPACHGCFVRIARHLALQFRGDLVSNRHPARTGQESSLDLALFVLYWLHLVAGPIVRVRELFRSSRLSKKFDPGARHRPGPSAGARPENVLQPLGGWVDEGFLPRSAHLNTMIANWARLPSACRSFRLRLLEHGDRHSAPDGRHAAGELPPPLSRRQPPDSGLAKHMTPPRWIRLLFFPSTHATRPRRARRRSLGISLATGTAWLGPSFWALHGPLAGAHRIWERLNAGPAGRMPSGRAYCGGADLAMVVTACYSGQLR